MNGVEIGMVCIKTKGREAGKKAVIIEVDKTKQFALIDGPAIKRRKCNLRHLFFTGKKIKVEKNNTKKAIISALEKLGE